MKRRLSIKARITLWYALVLVLICTTALVTLFLAADHAQTAHCRSALQSASVVIMDELEIEHGLLEIDTDIDDVPNVYAALFEMNGELIYGRVHVQAPFADGQMQRAQSGAHSWYLLDTRISLPQRDDVWLRLYMSADLAFGLHRTVIGYVLWLLPVLAAAALAGGYALTAGAFAPVKRMTRVAASIAGGRDLSGRVPGRTQGDELDELASTLNAMLERLEGAFEREQQFTSDVAHELRTPLNAVRTQGEYALSVEDLSEKDEALGRMLEKNEEMRMLVDQLLLIARLDAGQTRAFETVRLSQVLSGAAQDMQPVAEERSIRLETMLDELSVTGDRQLIVRAVINLLDNAIRYGREGGTVRLSLEKQENEAVIAVQDDGDGIAPEDQAHVFERFWRADSARSTAGTGIGLAIVQAAARAHGGSAQVSSEPGRGSRFEIRLPLPNAEKQ